MGRVGARGPLPEWGAAGHASALGSHRPQSLCRYGQQMNVEWTVPGSMSGANCVCTQRSSLCCSPSCRVTRTNCLAAGAKEARVITTWFICRLVQPSRCNQPALRQAERGKSRSHPPTVGGQGRTIGLGYSQFADCSGSANGVSQDFKTPAMS